MSRPLLSIVLLMLSVSACGRDTASSTPPVTQEQSPPASAPAAQPEAAAEVPDQTAESKEATAAQESITESTAEDRSDSSLERLAALPESQQLPNGRWKVGTNYKPLTPPQPTAVSAGKVEVVEVFWYGCPHCYSLEPFITSWLKNKPEYIEFTRLPVTWSPGHKTHAHLFYTLEALGRPDLHQKVFGAIHQDRNTLLGNSEPESIKQITSFVKSQGVNEKAFMDAWNSFGVASNLQRAEQLVQRYRVEGVPLVVVNGKYVADVSTAGGPSLLISLINDLAASEKRR